MPQVPVARPLDLGGDLLICGCEAVALPVGELPADAHVAVVRVGPDLERDEVLPPLAEMKVAVKFKVPVDLLPFWLIATLLNSTTSMSKMIYLRTHALPSLLTRIWLVIPCLVTPPRIIK